MSGSPHACEAPAPRNAQTWRDLVASLELNPLKTGRTSCAAMVQRLEPTRRIRA